MTLNDLLVKLKKLKVTKKWLYKDETYEANVIDEDNFILVENLLREYANDNHDETLGVLQAKVYTYEQIIANSNFNMAIPDGVSNKHILDKVDDCSSILANIDLSLEVLNAVLKAQTGDVISPEALLDATVRKNSAWNGITDSEGRNLEEIINSLRGLKE